MLVLLIILVFDLVVPALTNSHIALAETEREAVKLRYIWITITASKLPSLIGADMRTLHLASCIGGRLVEGEVYVLPRMLVKSFVAELGEKNLVPVYGEPKIESNDILLLQIALPARRVHEYLMPRCDWGERYTILGLENRLLVSISASSLSKVVIWPQGNKSILGNGDISFYIYFNKNSDNRSMYPSSIPSIAILKWIAKVLGVSPSRNSSSWFQSLRAMLASVSKNIKINVSIENINMYKINSLMNYAGDNNMQSPNWAKRNTAHQLQRYYWFVLSLDKRLTKKTLALAPGESIHPKTIYLGPYVEGIGAHIWIRNDYSSSACLKLKLTVYAYRHDSSNNHYRLWPLISINRLYIISPNSMYLIEAAPDRLPRDNSSLGLDVSLTNCGGAVIEVISATIDFLKAYPRMPAEEQRQGFQILSYGIAAINHKYSRLARYVEAKTSSGLSIRVRPDSDEAFSFTYGYWEGVYLDYSGRGGDDSGPVMYLDLAMRSLHGGARGYVDIYINGYNVARRTIVLSKDNYALIRLNISLKQYVDYFRWMKGGVVTIRPVFNTSILLYIDSMIKYNYLPGVWGPRSGSWIEYISPALKASLSLIPPSRLVGIIPAHIYYRVETPFILVFKRETLMAEFKVSIPPGSRIRLTSGTLIVKIPQTVLSEAPPSAVTRHSETNHVIKRFHKYLETVKLLHRLLTILTYITSPFIGGEKDSSAILSSNIAIDVIRAAEGQTILDSKGIEIINKTLYNIYQYSWSAGWSEQSHTLQMRIYVIVYAKKPTQFNIYISGGPGAWRLRNIPAKIVADIASSYTWVYEPPGFYYRNDIGYS